MEYTVQKLSRIAGISTRTLRYYDEIDLLKPARVNSSGYRIYGQKEVNRLQQILFYRELGVGLDRIKDIMNDPTFNSIKALQTHREELIEKRKYLDLLIANVDKTIASHEGRITMSDTEKFECFKQKMIDDNENKYGEEIREKYGSDTVEKSYEKLKSMTQEDFEMITRLEKDYKDVLAEAFKSGNPAGELAQKAVDLHRQWLSYFWRSYSKEAHAGLAEMYVNDERFRANYDDKQPGTAEFLRDAIYVYTGFKQ